MTWVKWVLIIYGLAMIGLGLEAYLSKDSLPSLMGGGGAGVLVLIATGLSFKWPRVGYILALLVCLGITGRFLPKFLKDGDVFPSLVIVILSLLTAACLLAGHVMAQKAKKAAS